MQKCNPCGKKKPSEDFYKSKPTQCKECISKKSKANYRKRRPVIVWEKCSSEKERKERRAKQFKNWLEDNREYNRERAKKWRENNSEHLQEYNQKNRDSILANTRKRQARKKAQTPDLSPLEDSMIKALYFISKVLSNSCVENFNVDHIIPLARGGTHEFSNLQILTEYENKSKGAK